MVALLISKNVRIVVELVMISFDPYRHASQAYSNRLPDLENSYPQEQLRAKRGTFLK
jgi:hypothetical protein